jgi:glycolate oxidase
MSPKAKRSKKKPEAPQGLRGQLQEVETCFGTSCNMCERDCPVYRVLRNRTYTSRGKNRALLGLLRGHYPLGKEYAKVVYECTLCGLCDARCALGNTERFLAIRKALAEEGLTTEDQAKVVDAIKATGDVYGRTVRTEEIYKDYADGDMPVYIGCTYKDEESEVRDALAVLEAMGVRPKIGHESCCGNVAHLMGFTDEFEEMKAAVREVFPYEEFLTICPSCAHVFRTYYGLNCKHVVEYIDENLDKLKAKVKPLGIKVTYHDPCDLGRKLKAFDQPRRILEAIGVEVVEMELNREFSHCCGAGGGLLVYDKDLAEDIGKNRIKMAADTGVDTIVTACPTCETQLTTCAMLARKEIGRRIKLVGLWGLVKKALK